MKQEITSKVPRHIGIIMDGNGRWAEQRGLPRTAGHKKGAKVFGDISRYCKQIGVETLTVYAFSAENWKRPKAEVDSILNLLREYLKEILSQSNGEGRLKFLGDVSVLDNDLKDMIKQAEEGSANNLGFTVNIALNYGGRGELVQAVKQMALEVSENKLNVEKINEELLSHYLYTAGQPDPDVIIRPGGEHRVSNFLLWQMAYAELIFMDVLWPDFDTHILDDAIKIYAERQRRFGGI